MASLDRLGPPGVGVALAVALSCLAAGCGATVQSGTGEGRSGGRSLTPPDSNSTSVPCPAHVCRTGSAVRLTAQAGGIIADGATRGCRGCGEIVRVPAGEIITITLRSGDGQRYEAEVNGVAGPPGAVRNATWTLRADSNSHVANARIQGPGPGVSFSVRPLVLGDDDPTAVPPIVITGFAVPQSPSPQVVTPPSPRAPELKDRTLERLAVSVLAARQRDLDANLVTHYQRRHKHQLIDSSCDRGAPRLYRCGTLERFPDQHESTIYFDVILTRKCWRGAFSPAPWNPDRPQGRGQLSGCIR